MKGNAGDNEDWWRRAWKRRRKKKERDKIEEKCSVRMIASRKAEIINMAIFSLSLGEQRTKEETGRRRMVGKVKNLVNIKRKRERGARVGIRRATVERIEVERRKILEPYRLVYSRSDNNSGDASRSFSRGMEL